MLGTRIGNYQVTAKLGEGGMGVVYLAQHAMLGRKAAVKVLRPEMSNRRDVVTRFFNEARAATAIKHPGIVEVFDFGYADDGSAYIVMELLDGQPLSARIKRGLAQPPARWLPLVRQIAGALQAAHAQRIVHRDLKPDNIFVIRDPEVTGGERIKLLDFGIAKLAPGPEDVSVTRTGAVLGTPTYMAPEQCRRAGDVDHRADLYALGCVMYLLACGRPPFVTDALGELIAKHIYFEPEPPRALAPALDAAVEQLILWLLRKAPDARPQTAAAVVAAIDQILGGSWAGHGPLAPALAMPEPAAPPGPMTTLGGSVMTVGSGELRRQRRRWGIAAGAATTLGVAVAIALAAGGSDGDGAAAAAPVAAPAFPAVVPVDAGVDAAPELAVEVAVDASVDDVPPVAPEVAPEVATEPAAPPAPAPAPVVKRRPPANPRPPRQAPVQPRPPAATTPRSVGNQGVQPFD